MKQRQPYRLIASGVFSLIILLCQTLWLPLNTDLSAQPVPMERRLILQGFHFIGNVKTRGHVIRRHLKLVIGDEITPLAIERSRQRLARTNFFKEVFVSARPGSAKGRVILVVEVKERRWPYFQFEGGHSDLDGWYFVPASLRFDNAFGRGSRLGLKWHLGDRQNKLVLGYSNTFASVMRLDADLFGGTQNFVHYFGATSAMQDVEFNGLSIQLAGTAGWQKHLFVRFRSVAFDPRDFARLESGERLEATDFPAPASIADDLEKTDLRTLAVGLRVDTRDNPVYPLKGHWGAITAEVSGAGDNRFADYGKLTVDGRLYQRLSRMNVVALHIKAAVVENESPFYDRFYLGGANSLRGYDDRRLTPAGWGTKLFLARAEWRIPITKEKFPYHKSTGVFFFDTGGIWQSGQVPKASDLVSTIGFGVRTRLPVVGLTRVDFSFPLKKIDENDFKVHISLGHTF